MHIPSVETILWDWNGTLLDDKSHCIRSMNLLLKKRQLPLLCPERYLQVFTFPVKEYYLSLGFDFSTEPFEIPAEEFIVHYNEGLSRVPLFAEVEKILSYFQAKGIRQYIVSAMEHNALLKSVEERNILHYFYRIQGINDNLAHGKTAMAQRLIQEEGIDNQRTVFIGDTLHDAEVASQIGVNCLLISQGHQHHDRLKKTGSPVLNSLGDVYGYFNGDVS